MLIPHVHQSLKGKPNKVRQHCEEIVDDVLKNRVYKILAAYKVNM